MSEDNKFVLLTENTVINYKDAGAWDADSDGEQGDHHHRGGVKQPAKMSAWGNVPVHNVDEAPSLSSIFEEETQKAKQAKQKQPQGGVYRAPKGGPGAGNRPTQPDGRQEQYGGGGGGDFNRAREKIPVPNEPPFNAFVGNLSFDVAEADLQEFFGELGTNSIKIMREEDGKPRGYAYIEFKTKDGLSKALLANGSDFHGRHLNMDVAKPPRSATNRPPGGNREFGGGSRGEFGGGSRGEFGGGSRGEFGNSRGEFGSSRGEFGSSDKERYDTNWGPSANKPFNSFNNRPSGRGSDMRGPGERPRLNINPPKPSAQATELHDNISKPKGSFENPFGTANLDHKKMDELEKERIRREAERDRRDKEKREEQFRNQQQQQTRLNKPQTPRDMESKTAASWRTNRPTGGPPAPARAVETTGAPKQKKLVTDEEGWLSKGHRGPAKDDTHVATKPAPSNPTTKPHAKKNDIDDKNIFSTLSELND